MKILITGFGPFRDIAENPSGILAKSLSDSWPGSECRVLEVSWEVVSDFARSDLSEWDAVLSLGVSAKADKLLIEGVGRNTASPSPDVRDVVWGPGPLDASASFQFASTLWHGASPEPNDNWDWSIDAGGYLCNALLFQLLLRQPDKKIGFIHVPKFETMNQDLQSQTLAQIVQPLRGF